MVILVIIIGGKAKELDSVLIRDILEDYGEGYSNKPYFNI